MKEKRIQDMVGSYIWSSRHGWIYLQSIDKDSNYPIKTPKGSYTLDGKAHKDDHLRSVWSVNKYDPTDEGPVLFREGEICMVYCKSTKQWMPKKFTRMYGNKYQVNNGYTYERKYIRKLNDIELGKG